MSHWQQTNFGDDQYPDPGIFTTGDRGNCKNFAESTVLADVCGVQVLLVIYKYEVILSYWFELSGSSPSHSVVYHNAFANMPVTHVQLPAKV